MPHFPKPFFVKARKLWYVQLGGRQINLGPDRDAAFTRYHELMLPIAHTASHGARCNVRANATEPAQWPAILIRQRSQALRRVTGPQSVAGPMTTRML